MVDAVPDQPLPTKGGYKTTEDLEYERERAKMQVKDNRLIQDKLKDFSFEVAKDKKYHPEFEILQDMISKAEESYRLFKKTGRIKEAKMIKVKLLEAIYAKEHLVMVMNMDFTRPTAKMLATAASQ